MKKKREKHILKVYAVYNLKDELIFTGTAKQCSEFIGCAVGTIWTAIFRGARIKWKYTICELEEKEYITSGTRVCSRCGKEKPLDQFPMKRKSHIYMCRDCYNAYSRQRRIIRNKLDVISEEALRAADLAKRWNVVTHTVYDWVHKRNVPYHITNTGRYWFDEEEIKEWEKNNL